MSIFSQIGYAIPDIVKYLSYENLMRVFAADTLEAAYIFPYVTQLYSDDVHRYFTAHEVANFTCIKEVCNEIHIKNHEDLKALYKLPLVTAKIFIDYACIHHGYNLLSRFISSVMGISYKPLSWIYAFLKHNKSTYKNLTFMCRVNREKTGYPYIFLNIQQHSITCNAISYFDAQIDIYIHKHPHIISTVYSLVLSSQRIPFGYTASTYKHMLKLIPEAEFEITIMPPLLSYIFTDTVPQGIYGNILDIILLMQDLTSIKLNVATTRLFSRRAFILLLLIYLNIDPKHEGISKNITVHIPNNFVSMLLALDTMFGNLEIRHEDMYLYTGDAVEMYLEDMRLLVEAFQNFIKSGQKGPLTYM